ncbi:MAG: hypothetical protein P8126_10085, partial [Gammaproteobacteria bacterium]
MANSRDLSGRELFAAFPGGDPAGNAHNALTHFVPDKMVESRFRHQTCSYWPPATSCKSGE